MKKKTGGGSDSTKVMPKELKGMKKANDNSTSYNTPKIHNISKLPSTPLTGKVQSMSKSELAKYRATGNRPSTKKK
jgi:hypothetical protein